MYHHDYVSDHSELKVKIDPLFEDRGNFGYPWSKCTAMSTIYGDNTKLEQILRQSSAFADLEYDGTLQPWLNEYGEDCFQEPHHHESAPEDELIALRSFVYFFDVPDTESLFYFIEHGEQVYINEKSGDLIVFDTDIMHGVDFNTSGKVRRTIAGNVWIKR